MFSVPAAEPEVGLPVSGAAGTFGRRCASVAGSAVGAAAVVVVVVDAAASAVRMPPAAYAADGAAPG